MTGEPHLIVVRAFSTPHEAHLACSALRAAGIDATIADENIVAVNWLYSNAVGGVKVLVRAGDARAAREVLDRPARVDASAAAEDVATSARRAPATCPRCGSQDLTGIARGKRLAVLTWIVMSAPLVPVRRRTRCRRCGYVFPRRAAGRDV